MGFPCVIGDQALSRRDFSRFDLQFTKTVLDFFPCETVQFITDGSLREIETLAVTPEGLSEARRAGIIMALKEQKPVVDSEALTLFLPVWSGDDLLAVAVLAGGSRDLYGRYSEDWLLERGRMATREFSLIKQCAHDPASGVLNLAHLRTELTMLLGLGEGISPVEPWQLMLIEVGMRAQDAGQALGNISRSAAYLDSLVGNHSSVHHVGAGVFALIWHGDDLDEVQKLGYTLLRKLKRQSTQKVHIGIAPMTVASSGEEDLSATARADLLLDKAWEALATARHRGTFAMSVASDSRPEQHLLAPIGAEALVPLKRLWQGDNQFSIVFLQKDMADRETFSSRVRALVGEGAVLLALDANRALIYLGSVDEQLAADWAGALANRIMPLGVGTFSMGVASYPCPGFHKADIPLNAKKALVHTQFFGAGTITSFSGVSLNISGDIYYNEGDLVSAIREYRLGLNLNPDNVNLLNSLGVIYAQIDSYAKAIPIFERAISLNPGDFMALFNLGFAHLCHGEPVKALSYFEQAEKIDGSYFDLLLQLGQLYCQRGQFAKAVKVLAKAEKKVSAKAPSGEAKPWERCEPWHDDNQDLGHGLVYRYLGEAYKGVGKNREAMTYLQRAARYNSRDSEALSLLGELYAAEQQGLDIALAFCRQAVEIDGAKAPYWYRMALVLRFRQEWDEAQNAVQHCLALDPKHIEAMMLKAAIHEKRKQVPLARSTYEKVLRLDGTHSQAAKALKKINQTRRSR
jgi:tetratricopeptide (TPR) repeat protein